MRLYRDQLLTAAELSDALTKLHALRRSFSEILPTEEVRAHAEAALERSKLRAADAFQLAAAFVLCHQRPRGRVFVGFDRRLREAAEQVGFTVLPTLKQLERKR